MAYLFEEQRSRRCKVSICGRQGENQEREQQCSILFKNDYSKDTREQTGGLPDYSLLRLGACGTFEELPVLFHGPNHGGFQRSDGYSAAIDYNANPDEENYECLRLRRVERPGAGPLLPHECASEGDEEAG
ncbi:hypothetical protein D3C81_1223030 [compost metagenome]